jgi:hypothetical protein
MSIEAILAPVFAQVALTFALLVLTGYLRVGAIRSRETKVRDIALGQSNWPPRPTQAGNCYNNQFQLPVLFYLLVILATTLHKADWLFVIMCWSFVGSRYVHAAIHTTSNEINWRFGVFLAGAVILLAMWIIFSLRILLGA